MKKCAKLFIFSLVMIIVLAFGATTAWAAEYEHCAEALQAMGLFQGSENGYTLDRAATRAEAAAMLVRLLGAEEEALSADFEHPFVDVPEWASPYIAYMYENGLTKGVSATTFNPNETCDLQMYSSFMLRALGYTEAAGDFTYATATDFARKLGVVDIITGSGSFKHDNLAAISYTALFIPTKGSQTMLLTQLIEAGIVEEAAAQPYLELLANYALIQAANAQQTKLGETPVEMKLDMTMKMDMGSEGDMNMALDSLLQIDAAGISNAANLADVLSTLDKIKLAMTNQIALSGSALYGEEIDLVLDLYLLDEVLYINTNLGELMEDETIPAKMQLNIGTLLTELDLDYSDLSTIMLPNPNDYMSALLPADPQAEYYGIASVKTIKSETLADGNQQFTITYIDIPNSLIQSLAVIIYGDMMQMPELAEVIAETDISCTIDNYSYILDADGIFKALDATVSVTQKMAELGTAQIEIQISMEVTKTGADVKFTLPGKAADYVDLLTLLGLSM